MSALSFVRGRAVMSGKLFTSTSTRRRSGATTRTCASGSGDVKQAFLLVRLSRTLGPPEATVTRPAPLDARAYRGARASGIRARMHAHHKILAARPRVRPDRVRGLLDASRADLGRAVARLHGREGGAPAALPPSRRARKRGLGYEKLDQLMMERAPAFGADDRGPLPRLDVGTQEQRAALGTEERAVVARAARLG